MSPDLGRARRAAAVRTVGGERLPVGPGADAAADLDAGLGGAA